MVRVIVVDLLCCVPDLDRRRLSSLAVQQRRRKMWMTLFRECLALFIVTFVAAVGVLVCLALIASPYVLWMPLAAAITVVLCKLALEIEP